MSGAGQGGPARAAPGLEAPHHRSWGSDDFQKLLATHFGGSDDNLPPSEVSPLLRLTTDGAMLTELLHTLEGSDAGGPAAGGHALFSEDTINRILGEQMAAAAAAARAGAGAPAPMLPQQQGSGDLQTAGSGQSATTVPNLATKMSLQEATEAMQAAHATSPMQLQPPPPAQHALPEATMPQFVAVPPAVTPQLTAVVPSPPSAGVPGAPHALPPPPRPAPQAQQFVAVVDGRVLQQPDGTAVLATVPGAAPATVALPGSNQVLQYIPVLGSQVIAMPQAAAPAQAFTPPFSGSPADGPAPVLAAVAVPPPGPAAATPPTTTPTSAAAAAAAIYTSEISTTQQLVAAAAAQQEMLRQEVQALASQHQAQQAQQALSGGGSGPVAMVTAPSGGSLSGGSAPVNLAMPPPPPRLVRGPAEGVALQAPTLTPQLRPAAAAPAADDGALTAATLAAQAAAAAAVTPPPAPVPTLRPVATGPTEVASTAALELTPAANTPPSGAAAMPPPPPRAPSAMDLMRELMQADERASAQAKAKAAAAATAATDADADADAPTTDLPRRPSHKRERSLRSASPLLVDPSTAPVAKVAKGNSEDGGGSATSDGLDAVADAILVSTLGSSPDSCLLSAAVSGSAGPSSGGGSPLGVGHSAGPGMVPPELMPSAGPGAVPPELMPAPAPAPADDAGGISPETIAAMAAALGPKPGAKRRGRPPKAAPAAAAAEPSDAEILEALLREDASRQSLSVDEIKKLVRKEKNRIAAAASRARVQTHTAALEGQVAALQAEQARLADWLQAPPQGPPHRVLLSGPAAAAAAEAAAAASKPPVRHLSM